MGERCSFIDDDDCTFVFAYKENAKREVVLSVQKDRGKIVDAVTRFNRFS